MADPLHVVVDDDTETIRVDPVTGTVETDQPDGGVVVQLDARKPKTDEGDEDKWFANIADDIDPTQLGVIANELIDAIGADDRSRGEYLEICARGMGLLGTKLEEPKASVGDSSSAVEGMSTVTNPLLLEALLKGWANAQAELLPANGPMKIRDDGDETIGEDEAAETLERDFNHILTKGMPEYYPETSHMLLWGVYFKGCGIKKVYRCPMRRRPVSESVDVKNFIVSDTTKDLRACGRITHEIPMRPSVMKRMQLIGAYRDVVLTQPTMKTNAVDDKIAGIQGTSPQKDRPEDQPYNLYETQCELDLDEFIPDGSNFKGEGIPLPYLVTIDKDSREILAVRRDWEEEDEHCERKRLYVRYPYVPGPGFYGTGLLNILGNASAAMTAAWRLSLDNAMFANFPAFLIAKLGGRQNTSDMRVGPGQALPIETNGLPIDHVATGLPFKEVGAGMMALIDKITQQAKEVGGTADIPTAEGIQNVPVGTMLAQIEQATKVMAAAHKGMHTAQSEEFDLILDLYRRNPEDFLKSKKHSPQNYWDESKFTAALDNTNLVPVADPNVPSHIHRIAKALALVQLIMIPVFGARMDPDEALKRILRAIKEDPQGLQIPAAPVAPGGPPQDPAKMLAAQASMLKAQTDQTEAQIKAQQGQTDQTLEAMKVQTQKEIAGVDLQREMVIHAHDATKDAGAAQLDANKQAHEQAMDVAQHGLAQQQHMADTDQANREHGLAVAQTSHDMTMDQQTHDLAVKEANKPQPKPAPKGKK